MDFLKLKYLISSVYRFFLTVSLLVFLVSCSTEEDTKCSSLDNCDENTSAPTISNVKLTIDFGNAYYYNDKLGDWTEITPDDFENGVIGERIPVYSDFVNLDLSTALTQVASSRLQFENQGSFTVDAYSKIPYIATTVKGDESYIYNYKKLDPSGIEVGGATGAFVKDGNVAYLPFVNAMFNDQFFPPESDSSQSAFTHVIQIVAQSTSSKSSDVATITFNAELVVQNKDFDVQYSDAMKEMTLANRWNYFYDGSDGVANTDLELASLVENTDSPESIPLDLRVVFKTEPIIEMNYKVFYEMPLVKDGLGYNDDINVIRGFEFYEKSYSLNSDRDFNLVFKLSDTTVPLTNSNREAEIRDLAAGTLWKMTFGYDLTQKVTYPAGKQMMKPLRPVCQEISGTAFNPLSEANSAASVENLGGFVAQCHPETFQKESIASSDLETTPLELVDTWYDYFSYIPKSDVESTSQFTRVKPGHFKGIRSIEFKVKGCLKVYTREASASAINPNAWELKNNESESCVSGPGDEGWMAYDISREISIFDDVSQYEGIQGLTELINIYRNAIPKTRLDYFFNGDNFVEHIH